MKHRPAIAITEEERMRLRALGVVALYLIGSRATGTATSRSDYDFAVVLDRASRVTNAQEYPETHRALYDVLTDVVGRSEADPPPSARLRDVDVVFLQRAPLYYTTHALRRGVLVYDGDPRSRVRFEERTRALVMEFRPLRAYLERALLASL